MDLRLDTDGDLLLDNGELELNAGLGSIRQHLAIRLKFFLGEWFLDTGAGVPYFQEVFVDRVNLSAMEAVFKSAITATPGVIELQAFTLDFSGRTLTINFRALTDFGILNFTEEVP